MNPGINNCGGQSVDFLLDTGATYSVLTEAPGPLSSRSASVMAFFMRQELLNYVEEKL